MAKSQPGCSASARCMKRSRETLARIDAAAIAALVASPSIDRALLVAEVADREAVGQADAAGARDLQQRVAQRGEVRHVQAAGVDPAHAARDDDGLRRGAQDDRVQLLARPRACAAWSR